MGKKRLRDMTWDDYGISKNRYKELKAFCLQYEEKKGRIRRGVMSAKDQGEGRALEWAVYAEDCRMIEEAAVRADPSIWKYLLRSVTTGLPYERVEYDRELGKIHMGRSDFYGTRRLFYSILNKLKIGAQMAQPAVVRWIHEDGRHD